METVDKKYNVFISHTSEDKEIAREIYSFIKEEFKGKIIPFLASDDIQSGDLWRDKIKDNLANGDALISLMTANSKDKPWIYIEWSAFWMENKNIHILLSDDFNVNDLISPLKDYQYVKMTNIDAINGFLQRLSTAANYRPAPYDKSEDLIVRIKDGVSRQRIESEKKSYDKYENKQEELPIDDDEKLKIATYFIYKENEPVFLRVFDRIKDEAKKFKLITFLVANKRFDLAIKSALEIRTPELQRDIIIDLLDEDLDLKKVYPLIESVAQKNQPQLRIILIHLIDNGGENSETFAKVLSYIENTPTLHKVATHLLQNSKISSTTFEKIAQGIYIRNAAEARKLGEELIENGFEESPQFDSIMKGIAKKNQMEAAKLMILLKASNSSLFEAYQGEGIIVSEAAKLRLEGEI